MKEVVLIFPDVQSMADFIVREQISNAEADSFEQTIIGAVSEDQIDIAKEVYGAMLKAVLSWVSFLLKQGLSSSVEFRIIAIILEPMKNCLVLLTMMLLSCKNEDLSPQEKQILQTRITRHNIATETKFAQDSINELQLHRTKYKKNYADGFQQYLKAHMEYFSDNWNKPYDIKKDRDLNLETYLNYCRAHKYSPMEYIKNID